MSQTSQLSPAGRNLLAERLRKRSEGLAPRPTIPRRGPEHHLQAPLSFGQERLWFLEQLVPGNSAYHIARAFALTGELDPARLGASLRRLVDRHESLRTTVVVADSAAGPVQRINAEVATSLPVVDLARLEPERRRGTAQRLRTREARRPFALARGPLLRLVVLRLSAEGSPTGEWHLLLTVHHIIADGWAMGVLCRELSALYAGASLSEPVIQVADFAVWQRAQATAERLEPLERYWRGQLAGAPAVLELPADRPRPAARRYDGERRAFPLGFPRAAVEAAATRHGATPYLVLSAAFFALLARTTGQRDLVLGTPVAGRDKTELEGLIGLVFNTLVLRCDCPDERPFAELLRSARQTFLEAVEHQELPFERLVELLAPERERSHTPLFQVLFALQNAGAARLEESLLDFPGLAITGLDAWTGKAKLELSFALTEAARGYKATLIYDREVFDATTMTRLVRHFDTLVAAALARPTWPLAALPLLEAAESQQLLAEWNDTGTLPDSPADFRAPCLQELIAAQGRATPDAVAVTAEGENISFGALLARSRALARRLATLGVGPESLVAVALERSVELMVALVATLEAGAAYVPLDPAYPRDRLALMLADLGAATARGAAVLLTEQPLLALLPAHRGPVILLDSAEETGLSIAAASPSVFDADHPAYVIYTSGSTGRPKGVINSHRAIVNRLRWMQSAHALGPDDRVLQKTPTSFDVSVWELFWPLIVGARLVMARPGGHQDSAYLVDVITRERLTTLHFVPSMLQVFLAQPGVERCFSLRRVFASGEALPSELARRFEARLGPRLHNLYGPTEAAVDVSFQATHTARGTATVPIGRPIANLTLLLLDGAGRLTPLGSAGHLHIGGVGLARGYFRRPALTAERFVPHPFSRSPGGERLYRTGDLARQLPDGSIEFLGRLDHQVKIRGFRIELGEIEAALAALPQVREAVVVVRGGDVDRQLVAYLVGAQGKTPPAEELARSLRLRLPEHMVPAVFVPLPVMPLTPSGKVDRQALPEITASGQSAVVHLAPSDGLERFLADLWRRHLGRGAANLRLGVYDDFFALGGNSVSGALLINRLQETLGEIVHVVAIFDAPTVAKMARFLAESYPETVARLWPDALSSGETKGTEGPVDAEDFATFRGLIPRRLKPGLSPALSRARNPKAIFLLSPPRSGSTLLRVLLAGHPRLFAPPELELLAFETLAERREAYAGRDRFLLEGLVRAVMELRRCPAPEAERWLADWEAEGRTIHQTYGALQGWLGDRFLVDKTPTYALDLEVLRRAEQGFAEAHFIHLVRHPSATIASFVEARLEQVFLHQARHPFSRRRLAELAWTTCHENILAFEREVAPERWSRVRFEDLVRRPEAELARICERLGLPFVAAMARPYEDPEARMTDGLYANSRMLGDVKLLSHRSIDPKAADRWRETDDESTLAERTRRLAAELGYELGSAAPVAERKQAEGASAASLFLKRAQEAPGEPAAGASKASLGAPSVRFSDRLTAGAPKDAGIVVGSWPPGSVMPLSFAQERLWFLSRLEPESGFYNIPAALNLEGGLDLAGLAGALAEIRRRHIGLRCVFRATRAGGEAVAQPPGAASIPVVELSALAGGDAATAARLLRCEGELPFDLLRSLPVRAALLRLSRGEHWLRVNVHHIVADGWSMGLLLAELAALYGPRSGLVRPPLPPPVIQYPDFSRWQRQRLGTERLEVDLAFWRKQLAGAPGVLALPSDRPRPPVQRFKGRRVPVRLAPPLAAGLSALCREQGVTLFMTLLAGFSAVLGRWSGSEDVVVGSPVSGRLRPETERSIGLYVNTLVLRADLAGNPSVVELLGRTRRSVVAALAHQELPFERLVVELAPERSLGHSPLVQVILMLQNEPPPPLELPGLTVTRRQNESGTVKFDLNLSVTQRGGGLSGDLAYNSDLFDDTTARRLMAHWETWLAGAAADPEAPLAALSPWTRAERQQALHEWNDTARVGGQDPDCCLHELFEATAERQPEAVALAFRDEALSYAELGRRTGRLAERLAARGAGPGALVAVSLERGPEMVAAVLAILAAGAAYVPLSASFPVERRQFIVESMGIELLISELGLSESGLAQPNAAPKRRLAPKVPPDDLAYIIFTSGSTGTPKGVMVQHRPAVSLIRWVNATFGVGPGDRLLFVTALSFDLSVYDLFGVLAAGATVRIASDEELRDPARLAGILREEAITFWDSAPAALQQLAPFLPATGAAPAVSALRLVFLSGDWIPVALPDLVRQAHPRAQVVSLGGATEATVWSNVFPIRDVGPGWTSIPYGRPIDDARYFVLDPRFSPCPIGVPGDLYIGGQCLSLGYAKAGRLSAERYLPNPFSTAAGKRLYKTGDRARFFADGNLEFLGRSDTQVKVRGFRIELGEIETVLATHPEVREAVVLAREDKPGDQRLVAYVIPAGETAPELAPLRAFLKLKLPEYMLPSALVVRESWPVSATGKLDRRALAAPASRPAALTDPALRPRSRAALEQTVAEIFRQVIGLEAVAPDESFFELGGHSLLLLQVQARLAESLGREVAIVELFRHPTVASLAQLLAESPGEGRSDESEDGPRGERSNSAPAVGAALVSDSSAIAILAQVGRFPAAASPEELWRNLCSGVEGIHRFTETELAAAGVDEALLADPAYVKARGLLAGADLFDAAFFDYSPREAEIMDPQQRLFLELAWEALELAGYAGEGRGRRVGVFAGASENTYVQSLHADTELVRQVGRYQISIGNKGDYLPTRVSYKLDLTGPSVNVQTACSTSLTAVHLACRALLAGECDLALAGGVSIRWPQEVGYRYEEGAIASPDGCCRAFDAEARGTVGGSGAGIVVLKRLAAARRDGDPVLALILGSGVNNDGGAKIGFTAPSVDGQAAAIRQALAMAGVPAHTVGYVEAHGTGTPMGDPIEVAALNLAYGGSAALPESLALGSVKTHIGHLDAAAGVTGLITTVLALTHRALPPTRHFTRPNPRIDFAAGPFVVHTAPQAFAANGTPRRAGVSSFGIGGTNAHAVLEEAPALEPSGPARPAQLLVLSAKTAAGLDAATRRLADHLETHPELLLADAAFTLQIGRRRFRHRRMVVGRSREEIVAALRNPSALGNPSALRGRESSDRDRPIAFLFPGQGAQRAGMAAGLLAEPAFADLLAQANAQLAPELGFDFRRLLGPEALGSEEAARRLGDTATLQPVLFAVEVALVELLSEWGIHPVAMLGHSLGEYVAAWRAGVFSFADGLRLVATRGRLMAALPPGEMSVVRLGEAETRAAIEPLPELALAAVNAPASCTVSGSAAAMACLRQALDARGVEHRKLPTSHAFHSALMEPMVERFRDEVARIELKAPTLPYLSCLTGTWITAAEATDPGYWAEQLRHPVRFADGASELLAEPGRLLLEVGPGSALSSAVRQQSSQTAPAGTEGRVVATLPEREGQDALATVLGALGELWLSGAEIDWAGLHAHERRHRVALPTYPFERKAYRAGASAARVAAPATPTLPTDATRAAGLESAEAGVAAAFRALLGTESVTPADDFFALGGTSLLALRLVQQIRETLAVDLPVDLLLSTSTVAGLGAEVARRGAARGQPASSCLVPLSTGGGRRPLFLVHQVGGHVFSFRALARQLAPHRPLFALRSRGLVAGEAPLAEIGAMAAHYLDLVRGVEPRGPYLLGGASMGGLVAVEMARQLSAAGEQVPQLVLMDVPCREVLPGPPSTPALLAQVLPRALVPPPEELQGLEAEAALRLAIDRASATGTLPTGFDAEEARRLLRVLATNIEAMFAYELPFYSGRALYFRALERRPQDPARPELPWIERVGGGLEIHLVPGNHATMHDLPHVTELAARLERSLGAVERG